MVEEPGERIARAKRVGEARRRDGERGRPRLSDEERAEAKRAGYAKMREGRKNVSLDNETVAMLLASQERLKDVLGFQPTLAQTVRYLIKEASK